MNPIEQPFFNDLEKKLWTAADKDEQLIEHLLDHLLDFCFDETVLRLFKRLCRYYFTLNPAAAQYIHFYREIWDTKNAMCEQE